MKTKLLFLSLFFVSFLTTAQLTFIAAPINNGSTTGLRAPNGTAAQTTLRAHFIIPASELTAIANGAVITDLGVNLSTGAVGVASGNLHFYLENTSDVVNNKSVDWSVATTPMSTVYNGAFTIPTATGTSDFTLTNSFTYNGGGIYVAYEYIGSTFATTGAVYLATTTMSGSCRTGATGNSVPLDSLDQVSDWRPEVRFGFINSLTNNLAVTQIRPQYGSVNRLLIQDNSVDVEISNFGTQAVANTVVSLELEGSTTFTASQNIALISAGTSQILTFNNVPTESIVDQNIKVFVPADQDVGNDTLSYLQTVSCDSIGYTNSDPSTQTVGIGPGNPIGILGVRYDISNVMPINIKTIDFLTGNSASAIGSTIKGVLLNSNGVLVDSTLPYTFVAGDLGQSISLPLLNGNVNYSNQTVFAGIRISDQGVFPLAMQQQFNQPVDRNFYSGLNGGVILYQNTLAQFMVLITVQPAPVFLISNTTTGVICSGAPITFTTFPTLFDNYTLVANNVSLQTNTNGVFTESPLLSAAFEVEMEKNGCFFTSNAANISTVSEYSVTLFEDICSNNSYDFYGQSLNTTGQYIDTIIAVGGCDSIVTLNLTVAQVSATTLNESICAGESYDLNGQSYTVSGTYTEVLQNSVGCDSTITLNLTVALDDMSITENGATLTVAATGPNVTYQWIDCDNNAPISGATSQSFTPTDDMGITGSYAVEVTAGNCTETSACSLIDFTAISDFDEVQITVFPNPVVDFLTIQTSLAVIDSYTITDATGKLVLNGNFTDQTLLTINTSSLAMGTYVLTLASGENHFNKVFFK